MRNKWGHNDIRRGRLKTRYKSIFFLIILLSVNFISIASCEVTFTDNFLNENYIETYDQITVNTTLGEILLEYDYYGQEDVYDWRIPKSRWVNGTDYIISDNSLNVAFTNKAVSYWYNIANGETTTNYEFWDTGFSWLFKQGTNDNQLYLSNGTHGFRYRGFTMANDGNDHFKVLNMVYNSTGHPSYIEEYDDNVLTQNRTSSDYNVAFVIDLFVEIGRSLNTGGINANYTIDHFQIYNRTLTTDEIKYNYNSGLGIDHVYNETDLLRFYAFNNRHNGTVYDRMNNDDADTVFYNNGTHVDGIVQIDYYDDGLLYSSNLVDGLNTTQIKQFNYNCSYPASNTTVYIQYSENNSTWYSSNGVLNGWDLLTNGTGAFNILNLGFTSNIFYRTSLNTTNVYYTPKIFNIGIIYEESMTDLTVMNMIFILSLFLLVFGVLGVFRPIIALISLVVGCIVLLPQIAGGSLNGFLNMLAVVSLVAQFLYAIIGFKRADII